MRRLVLALVVLLSVGLWGCSGDDPAPLFADVQWQVRCDISRGCSSIPARDINNLDGEDGHRVTCSAEELTNGNLRLSFRASKVGEYSISVQGAEIPPTGGAVSGAGCITVVQEEGNDYEGGCGSSPPADTCRDDMTSTECLQPCQVSGIVISDEPDGPTVTGNLFCQGLANRADLGRTREVTFPGTDASQPVQWRFVNCTGL